MTKEKFTPGQWCLRSIEQFAEYGNSTKHIFVKKEDGKLGKSIATISKGEEAYDNGVLIATSPKMYRFIKRMYDCGLLRRCDMEEAEKLLKEARGEWV